MTNHQDIITEDIKEIIDNIDIRTFDKLKNKNILITGANGFLASYIVDTIIYLNDNFDINCTMICPILSSLERMEDSRLGHLIHRKDITFIQHDVINSMSSIINMHIDFIIHAAGRSTPKYFVNDPIGTIDVNVMALRWLLDLAVKDKTESFVYYSSAEVYGNPTDDNIPTAETCPGNTLTTEPRSCYSESKRCGEALCLAFYRKYLVPVKILRPAIIYGPGLSIYDSKVISEFIKSAILNDNIKMINNGERIRNFCYISDATTMFWKIFLSDKNGEIFNIGSYDNSISIRELARAILKLCNKNPENIEIGSESKYNEPKPNYTDYSKSPYKVCLDMNKLYNTFGYKSKISLEDGLRRTIDWNRYSFLA
jgi:dTDP-glucose 4,6-dehydratase/UDP-glucuronate decarboxylase